MKFIRDEQTNLDKKRTEEKTGTVNIKLMSQKKRFEGQEAIKSSMYLLCDFGMSSFQTHAHKKLYKPIVISRRQHRYQIFYWISECDIFIGKTLPRF